MTAWASVSTAKISNNSLVCDLQMPQKHKPAITISVPAEPSPTFGSFTTAKLKKQGHQKHHKPHYAYELCFINYLIIN